MSDNNRTTRILAAALIAGVTLCARPAAAQTTAPAKPAAAKPAAAKPAPAASGSSGSMLERINIEGEAGIGAVQKAAGAFGGSIGFHVSDMLEVFGEVSYLQNVVTRRRLDLATTVASFLQTAQGATAVGTITAPATYGGAGARIFFMKNARVHPYVSVNAGVAHIALQPKFTLAGADVTTTLNQFGITLGADLTGESSKAAFGGGFGVRMPHDKWFIDGAIGVTSIRTPGQPTNVVGAHVGLGWKF